MIETTLGKARQFATHTTNLFDEAESLNKDYNENNGRPGVLAYFSRPDVEAGLNGKTAEQATDEYVNAVVVAQAIIALRTAGHGTNLAPLR